MNVSRDAEKQLAGEFAAGYVKDGMTVGLGTGSTVYFTILKLAERVKQERLHLTFVSTSVRSTELAESLGLHVDLLNDVPEIDLTIDGCDEFDPELNGIKGGGGALLYEKIVAQASRQNIWVADRKKEVQALGAFPLPVEVLRFGSVHTVRRLQETGCTPKIRLNENGDVYLSDSQNLIVDLQLNHIENPEQLSLWLNQIPGVVENGLFIGIADQVILPDGDGTIKVVKRKK